jgi:carboxyl-terminal processing protease
MQRLSQDGKTERLIVMGPGAKSLEALDVTAAATQTRPVEVASGDAGTAEIRISGLTKSVGPELDQAISQAVQSGAKRLVLDLRGCVGGSLERAALVAGRFTDGPLGTVDRKAGKKIVKTQLVAHKTGNEWNGPLVVMVNHSTLGAAEFLAGSLSARHRATLVGARTFGDGLEHTVVVLKDGSSLLMTTGKIYISNGQSYQARGVSPAVAVASAADQASAAMKAFR